MKDSIFSIVKDQEDEIKKQIPSFMATKVEASPSKLMQDYEKTGDPVFKKAAGQALEFLSTSVQKAKEWAAPKAEALGGGLLFAGAMATPRGRRMMAEEVAPTVFKKLKNTWYGSVDEVASVLSKPRMYTPDEQVSLFAEHIQPKLEKLKTPRDDQALVFYQPADGVGGQYVNTKLDEVFHYPVDKNLKVKIVSRNKLKSTGDDAKDAIGYRILDTSSGVNPIRGDKGLFKGSKAKELPAEELFKGLTHVQKRGDSLKLSAGLSKAVGDKSETAFLDEYDVAMGMPHDIMPIEKLKPSEYDNFSDIRTMIGEPNNKTIEVRNAAVDNYKVKLLAGEEVEPIIITVDSKTGQAYVKDGHHRVQAHIELGKTDIPVFYDGKTLRNMWQVSQKPDIFGKGNKKN